MTTPRGQPIQVVLLKTRLTGPVSGADEIFLQYAVHLHRAGHLHSAVLLYEPDTGNNHWRQLRDAGVRVATPGQVGLLQQSVRQAGRAARGLELGRRLPWLRALRSRIWQRGAKADRAACAAYLRRTGADLVHLFYGDAGTESLIDAARDAGMPVLCQELTAPEHLPEFAAGRAHFVSLVPRCSEAGALSPRLADGWTRLTSRSRPFVVLPLIVDPPAPAAMPARERGVTFGFAGRLERAKGPLTLVEAFARIRSTVPGARLRLAGSGSVGGEARALAGQLGVADACEFAGYLQPGDKVAFMRTLDIFVLPTLAEGTPNSVAEAMALGIPTIASDVGGLPDMLTADAGLLVPPGDVDALARAMIALGGDPDRRARMSTAAHARYEQLFAPAAVVPLLVDTYRRILSATAQPPASAGATRHPWAPG